MSCFSIVSELNLKKGFGKIKTVFREIDQQYFRF